ncbi:hypothetical protein [Streptacidiphilus cavernicola]|uniref:Uncharacterized protein n=1 Tax=Streptacidiphilus cavernicola TaxID=3342716 RepID=A0ABV6W0R5_9ACTN
MRGSRLSLGFGIERFGAGFAAAGFDFGFVFGFGLGFAAVAADESPRRSIPFSMLPVPPGSAMCGTV